MIKGKYLVVFILILLCVIYQLILSFNVVPFFFSGQDLFVIILLLLSLTQLFIAGSLEKVRGKVASSTEDVQIKVGPSKEVVELSDLEGTEEKSLLKHILNLQRYLKESQDMKDVISKMLVAAARITHSGRASVLLFDKRAGELYIHRTLGWDSNEIKLTSTTRIKPGEGIAGRVFIEGKPFVLYQPEDRGEIELNEKYKSNTFACFPLLSGWEVVGVLNLTEKESGTYTQSEIDMVSFIIQEISLHLVHQMGKKDKV